MRRTPCVDLSHLGWFCDRQPHVHTHPFASLENMHSDPSNVQVPSPDGHAKRIPKGLECHQGTYMFRLTERTPFKMPTSSNLLWILSALHAQSGNSASSWSCACQMWGVANSIGEWVDFAEDAWACTWPRFSFIPDSHASAIATSTSLGHMGSILCV